MAFKFPFTNYHELNLTWVLEQLKKLFEDSEENVETIEGYEDRLSAVEDELPVVEATAEQAATTANAAASLAQTAKSTADTANENALTASAQAGLARQEAATAEAEAQAATQAAQQAQATAQNFDGRITQAEADASEALQEAQSFENRVNAAINTANNAANTATIAQGIAVNANQSAAAALDAAQIADGKAEAAQDTADQNADNIGNLSELTTTAKNNLVAAINEAAQTGGGTDNTKAPLIIANASGDVVSIKDGADNMAIRHLIASINPIQAGTGDPSPSNIRQISGRTGLVLSHGADVSEVDTISVSWQTQAGVIYGGSLDLVTGKLTKIAVLEVFDTVDNLNNLTTSLEGLDYIGTSGGVSTIGDYTRVTFALIVDTSVRNKYNLVSSSYDFKLCNMLKHSFAYNEESAHWYRNTALYVFFPTALVGSSVQSVRNYLVSIKDTTPLTFWIPLATPQIYQLDPVTINTLLGNNIIYADSGPVSVDYPADTKMYIDDKITELQALILEN